MSVGIVNKQTGDRIPTAGMPAIDDALDLTSANPVQNAIVTAALALKQDKTDNNLQTTDKTVVGAINEHEGDIDSLKSGLTTLDNEVNGDATVYPYADVITIEDAIPANVADCNVKIDPVQDLHGYDKPWVGGAGKNKLPMTVDGIKAANTRGTWSGNAYTYNDVTFTILTDSDDNVIGIKANGTASADAYILMEINNSAFYETVSNKEVILNGCPATGSSSTYYIGRYSSSSSTVNMYDYGSGVTFTYPTTAGQHNISVNVKSGYTANNLKFYPMICLATETDATFAPYTNICPITGHTDASVQRDGKNLCSELESGTLNEYGMNTARNGRVRTKYYIHVVEGQQYVVSALPSVSGKVVNIAFNGFAKDDYATHRIYDSGWLTSGSYITIPSGVKFVRCVFRYETDENITPSSFEDVQLELGQTATPYVPYAGKTYTLALGDTIYGGTVDFDSGVMTVTHGYADLGNFTYTKQTSENGTVFYTGFNAVNNAKYGNIDYVGTSLCSCFEYASAKTVSSCNKETINVGYDTSTRLRVCTDAFATLSESDFKTAVTGQTLCYELATPTTIQLTPQQIQLLKGTNTLTASTGEISVTVNGVSGAIGSLTSDKQDKTDYALETTDKTVVGGINELLARPSYIYNIEQPQSISDLVGKFMVVGKICFFQLSATKTNTSYNLGVIRGISCLIEGVVAYDNVNDVPVYIVNDPNTTAVVFQIKSGATYTNPTVISGMFFLA